MSNLTSQLKEIETQLDRLREKRAALKDELFRVEMIPAMRALIGQTFKYQNRFSAGEPWWLFMRVVAIEGESLKCLTIQNCEGKIEIDLSPTSYPLMSTFIPIPLEEFTAGVTPIIAEIVAGAIVLDGRVHPEPPDTVRDLQSLVDSFRGAIIQAAQQRHVQALPAGHPRGKAGISMRKITGLVPRFGSNRMNAEKPGELLGKRKWIGIPFCGGMSEVPHMQAPAILVNDRDSHVINLAQVVMADCAPLIDRLNHAPFHPSVLQMCQDHLREREGRVGNVNPDRRERFNWACDYFVACWMARNDSAGTDCELDAGLSIRWNGNGGDSCTRFRNATAALAEWEKVLRRCSFECMDGIDFVRRCSDKEDDQCGIYVDAPWPDDGDRYKHKFPEAKQRELAKAMARFERTRVVIRYGEHPLIRELYPESAWHWHSVTSRTQANTAKAEVLITNFPAVPAATSAGPPCERPVPA